jgi:phage protein
MHEICPGRLTPEVTRLLNEKFGTNYTKTQIGGVRKRLGLPVGNVFKNKLLNKEQHDYFIENQQGKTAQEIANEMNEIFGLSLTVQQVKSYRSNNNLTSGLTGRFEKGRILFNKGKKFPNRPRNSGQFKKGNKPPNYLPVGTINFTTDGYPKEKIADPNKWVLKHRKVWEDNFGPIPEGYSVCFLDGDKSNYEISNLILLSNEELARMNQNNYFSTDPELTKLGAGITKLSRKIKQQE